MNAGDYLVSRIRAALATDPEVGSLDIAIAVAGEGVHLSGVVDCAAKRDAAAVVAALLAPGMRVVNELKVLTLSPAEAPEVIDDSVGGHR
jgi:osmotically-inducible protein OsmY